MSGLSLSVVIAVQMAQQNLPEIVRRLACERHPEVEFLVCYADADPDVPRLLANQGNIRVLPGLPGSLIPHLWRDGILAARHETVAITTAHCIPDENWLQCLLQADLQGVAGIGGVIENHANSDAKGWAIFLLRYIAYAPPQAARRVEEIAADNALYRRTDILGHQDLLRKGFWEPSFHARFRAAGLSLVLEPRLRAVVAGLFFAGCVASLHPAVPGWIALAMFGAIAMAKGSLLRLFYRRKGPLFALGGLLFHQVYYLYSSAAFAWCWLEFQANKLTRAGRGKA